MSDPYRPTSRRPIAQVFRSTAGWAVRFCVATNIHPDAVSYSSIIASLVAGLMFWQSSRLWWLLILAPLFCYLRLWLNMLDGMVAIASGKASRRGELLNELPDRISDVLIFAGVAHSGLCLQSLGYWSAIMALLTAYVGMFGQALGGKREYGGVMSKQWRMVVLNIGAWMTPFAPRMLFGTGSPTVLDLTCIVVFVGCLQTIAVRLRSILKSLQSPK